MAVYLLPVQGTFRWPCDDDIAWDLTSVECRWQVCGVDRLQEKGHGLTK
ncbi:hypothetical protein [Escherichia coli]|nr:hypothetical protein [Escherichia coli]